MKKVFLLLICAGLLVKPYCQLPTADRQLNYWQQQVNYTIDVSLDDTEHRLTGFEKIDYINNSPDTLRFIWFHLWPNAYKNDKTAFSDHLLDNGNTKFYFSGKEDRGYINKLDFKVNGVTAQLEDHPQHIDIVKLVLPGPLTPGQSITITTPFHVKLPYNFSRGGHDGQSYQVTQWYPKPAVYDREGWHPMPYLDQGEFYSEFGNFEVKITVPKNYVVAATGELQNAEEKEWLKTRAGYTWEPVKQKTKTTGGQVKTSYQLFPESEKEIKILTYKQSNIHDFAWFADKRFIVNADTCLLASSRIIDVFTYFTPAEKETWEHSTGFAKDAIRHYSSEIGEYPYSAVSVVQGPESFGGGMEYPTITVISPSLNQRELDYTIAHEVGHNWFYGILGTNERSYPWMDEGINSFYEYKYQYNRNPRNTQSNEQALLETLVAEKKDQPIATAAEDFTEANYALVAYYKTSKWMEWLEKQLGREPFQKAMQHYFRQWRYRHPQPEDFKKSLEASTGKNLDSVFAYLRQKGNLPTVSKKGIRIQHPVAAITNAVLGGNSTKKTVINLLPAAGFNSYDKFMLGLAATNLRLPPTRFRFFWAGFHGFGSKKKTMIGFASYSFYPEKVFHKVDIGVSSAGFTYDSYTAEDGKKVFPGFFKFAPGIRFTLKEKSPRSTLSRFIQFKTYLLSEDKLLFYRDTVITGIDTSITLKALSTGENRVLNQLKFVVENYRALYPYRAEFKLEQGKDFLRTTFTGNYFFNYAKEGGLRLRFFAGKFFYTGSKTISKQFTTDRYHLNLTGANGYEDYTYSDYFIGRNEFEGIASQQIMERDGAFKVRTDLLAEKVGRTDNWLFALNASTTVPSAVNPLSILPVKIPLKIFADIGTYAEAWESGATADRFLFDAGLQIPLLKETINIYVPLVFSSVYRDYYQSTIPKKERFGKKISFSIDISNFSLRKLERHLDF
ncbi:MAG: M1 family metallopeptidase [Sphingobacteriales bacterium]|nr:M1 family metallopeptidase [Sphingobacteriales bacterium]